MKNLLRHFLLITLFFVNGIIFCQNLVSLEQGKQVFYSFEKGITGEIQLKDWDIAIEPAGEYAIRLNEISGARVWVNTDDLRENCTLGLNCKGLQDYEPVAYDTIGMAAEENNWLELHNGYENWEDGAFNAYQEVLSTNLASYGWGGYKGFTSDPLHAILGYRIFIVKTQSGSFKQFFVRKSLSSGYEFAFANIDGTEKQEMKVLRDDYENKMYAYVSLDQRKIYNPEPVLDDWDVVLTQYPEGKTGSNYQEQFGILQNPNLSTNAINSVGNCIQPDGNYSEAINTIGHSWSELSASCNCQIASTEKRFFIEKADGSITLLSVTDFKENIETFSLSHLSFSNDALAANGLVSNITCATCNDGAIRVYVAGGVCPYTFQWQHGPNTNEVSNLAPGDYSVTITDNSGKSIQRAFTLESFPCDLTIESENVVAPSCFGSSDGSISVNISGGTAPLTYAWNGEVGASEISNLSEGVYELLVKDANQCEVSSSISVTQPTALSINPILVDESCFECNDGSATLQATGGTAPYSYDWSSNSGADDKATSLAPGNYLVTVIDANGCSLVYEFVINSFHCNPFTLRPTLIHNSCFSNENGSIEIAEITGGVAPYSYVWSTGETGVKIQDLKTGTYAVTIRDDKNCTQVDSFKINAPNPIEISASITQVSCSGCEDASIILDSVVGGVGSYNYFWNDGVVTRNRSNLSAGNYQLTITDENQCEHLFSFKILEFGCDLEIANIDKTPPSCYGLSNGELSVDVAGANGTLAFEWSNGGSQQFISNIPAGVYALKVTDETGCVDSTEVTLSQPDSLSILFNFQEASCGSCNDAILRAFVSGGNQPYTYLWNEEEGTSEITVAIGAYQLEVQDALGCTAIKDTVIEKITGIASINIEAGIRVFPNPSNGKFYVAKSKGGIQLKQLQLLNAFGQQLLDYEISASETLVDISQYAKGIYLLKITLENGVVVHCKIELNK